MSSRDPQKPRPGECCPGGNCGGIERRDFIKSLTLGAAATAMPVMAGAFETAEQERLIPADKKLGPGWVKSLFDRGVREVYRGKELEKIGMPVGGLCAGQLYLGGDGKLWHWDIFNKAMGTGDHNYAHPPLPSSPLEQGFAVEIDAAGTKQVRALDHTGFSDVSFRGEYPIAYVEFRDPQSSVTVSLEAFSPHIPLNTDESSLPATVMRYSVKNISSARVEVQLAGWLENAVGLYTSPGDEAPRRNRVLHKPGLLAVQSDIDPAAEKFAEKNDRRDIVFEDFQKPTYEGWTVTGDAFGKGPILKSDIPNYQGDVGSKGPRVVNSHASAPGRSIEDRDNHTGTLTSKPFTVDRNYIRFWIGGGKRPGETGINLLIDGKAVRTATGHDNNRMRQESFDVRKLQGKTARLVIFDKAKGPWGNIGAGPIVFTDHRPVRENFDRGTLALALLDPAPSDRAAPDVPAGKFPAAAFVADPRSEAAHAVGGKLIGAVVRKMVLEAGEEASATFVIAWHFPRLQLKDGGRFYATRFDSALSVAEHVAGNFTTLHAHTRLWHDTWYDSTLPYWFLDRTYLNTSILATSTAHRFASGRFYGWEGVGCCEGTCTHVWHYAHAVARLFPDLERDLRRRTDFGTAQDPRTGMINHRGESAGLAVDGQAGCILRAYREHQMSKDAGMLKELWPRIKLAMLCLIHMDKGEGLVEGAQHNTLDQPWFGKVAWLSSLYLAALRACEVMAHEVGDHAFASKTREIFDRGSRNLDRELFNGEYFYQLPDKEHARSVGSHNGCEIDQVFGQSWAFQVGLGRILPEGHVKEALAALWKYNFALDVGPFRKAHKPGRWYAMAGEAGLIMCSWPRGEGARVQQGFDFYFNECMNGFEYQVAGHMIWEGLNEKALVEKGLAVARAVHDRYHPSRRNPWNEIECGDHYARSMASYGVFLAACGYEYHGPKGHLAFAPRLSPGRFRAAFTAAEGWGTFSQKDAAGRRKAAVIVRWGKLALKTLGLLPRAGTKPARATVTLAGRPVDAHLTVANGRATIEFAKGVIVEAGQELAVELG
jgi:non-lysosomal glucosylceramidase